jgi:Pyridoxamine 5'-phosphate oxidase
VLGKPNIGGWAGTTAGYPTVMSIEEHGAIARAILDGNEYMTLATVDPDGHPWATPVHCASRDYRSFY